MAGICEAGHRSETDDYCDVCGLPVMPAGMQPPSGPKPSPSPQPTAQRCPNCSAANPLDALFCEACGYDYTTGTLPRGDLAEMLGLSRPRTTDPSMPTPAEEEPVSEPVPNDDDVAADAAPAVEPSAETPVPPSPDAPASTPIDDEPPTRGRPAPRREVYVAEVWIDPDWYDVQSSPEAMPSVGLPEIVKLGDSNLIGRESRSRNIIPEIDCGLDTGCSRRQAMLTTDGTRWYVEDLGSANGTFVGPAAGPLPTDPITGRTELGPDDRIYVGAWTRIVVRKSSREEIDALG